MAVKQFIIAIYIVAARFSESAIMDRPFPLPLDRQLGF
jgi:hypothetical protein